MTQTADWRELLAGVDIHAERLRALRSDIVDPYPVYAELREQAPVYEGDILLDCFRVPSLAQPLSGERPVYSVTRWEECNEVARDHETFSNTLLIDVLGPTMGINMLLVDPPEHTRLRDPVRGAFSKRSVEHWRDSFVRPLIERDFFDPLAPKGRGDLMRELAIPLPIAVVYQILGLPPERVEEFRTLALGLNVMHVLPELGLACSAALEEMLTDLMERRRAEPQNDLVSEVLGVTIDGDPWFTDLEVLSFMRVMLAAGSETTTASLGPLIAALLAHPEQLERVRSDPSLVPVAVEEALRWEAPNQFIFRISTRETSIAGVPIPKGAGIVICQGAANRDPARWDRPDEFDIFRTPHPHLSFGNGIHNCIGAHLGRMEVTEALAAMLERLPGLRQDPEFPAPVVGGIFFRAPEALPVRWDV